jgi:mono/diheme cytochrome c family protein
MRPFFLPFVTAGILAATTLISAGRQVPSAVPSYTRDVAPIVDAHCAGCHRPGEIGPMSLLTYEEVRPWARAIVRQVEEGHMPPWHADALPGTFENERRLTREQIAMIAAWAAGGAPQGSPEDRPTPPSFVDGWSIGEPDLVVSMPQAFDVPAAGTIDYQYFEAPVTLTEDRWIEAMEVRPGARSVVHHVIVYEREPSPMRRPRFAEQDPRIARTPDSPGGPRRPLGYQLMAVATGTGPSVFRPGTARLLKAGATLTFQMHYTTNGTPARDRTRIGFRFAKQPPERELRPFNMVNGTFVIPPGAQDHRVEASARFVEDVTLYSILPHTHLRGKRWEYALTYADGTSEVILRVPKYDFGWQTDYRFTVPLRIPKGSVLRGVAWYDNSSANRSNPDPGAEVRWGDQTWQEMQFTALLVTVDNASLPAPPAR